MKTLLVLFLAVLFIPMAGLQAQPLTDEVRETVLAEIESLHRQEQKAFVEGDCEKVISFYDENATIYTRGRRRPSLEVFLNFCNQIPRPFKGRPNIDDKFFVLSGTAGYFVRTIDFEPEGEGSSDFKREVITKIWAKTSAGWKIVHFHASTHTVSPR